MERKIGEIFEYKGEWYQCLEQPEDYIGIVCKICDFSSRGNCELDRCSGTYRSDKKPVFFKKLEKVGEPIVYMSRTFQRLKLLDTEQCKYCYFRNQVCNPQLCRKETFLVEIKQNKEEMEENKLNLKPFDIQKAREGKPVCTRDGHKARIICFDYNGETGDYPIVALVHYNKGNKCYERVLKYTSDGLFNKYRDCQHDDDLMMLPEKKEGWIIKPKDYQVYQSKTDAEEVCNKNYQVVAKITWEE